MALWDGLKALFAILLGIALLILSPFIMALLAIVVIFIFVIVLVISYVAFKADERALRKASPS